MNNPRFNVGGGTPETPPGKPPEEIGKFEVPPEEALPPEEKPSEPLETPKEPSPQESPQVQESPTPGETIATSNQKPHIREQDVREGPLTDVSDAERLAEIVNQMSG